MNFEIIEDIPYTYYDANDITKGKTTRKSYNYRINYRNVLATRGVSENYLHGTSLLRKRLPKRLQEDVPNDELYYDAMEFVHSTQLNIFNEDIKEIELDIPDYIFYSQFFDYVVPKIPKKTSHKMSDRTKAKLKDKIYSFYRSTLRSQTFLTLTFINNVTDEQGVKCLNKFLTALRKKDKINYLWIAEKQKENSSNVHFHIIVDRYYPIEQINALWVLQQYNDNIRRSNIDIKFIEQLYYQGSKGQKQLQKFLNPVDVIKVNGVNGLSAYLTKYVTKNSDRLHCRVWHCSRTVSSLATSQQCSKSLFNAIPTHPQNYIVNKKTGEIYYSKSFPQTPVHFYCHTIVNKRAFLDHLKSMENFNKRIMKGERDSINMDDFKLNHSQLLAVQLN
jgi:hypothetical protein